LLKSFILHEDELPKFEKFLSIIDSNFLVPRVLQFKNHNNLLFTNSMKRIVCTVIKPNTSLIYLRISAATCIVISAKLKITANIF